MDAKHISAEIIRQIQIMPGVFLIEVSGFNTLFTLKRGSSKDGWLLLDNAGETIGGFVKKHNGEALLTAIAVIQARVK